MLVWKAMFRSRGRAALSSSLAPVLDNFLGPLLSLSLQAHQRQLWKVSYQGAPVR